MSMQKKKSSYVITSGWWSTEDDIDDRTIKVGDSFIRSKDFHKLWYEVIDRFTKAKKVYIVDSASPVKPILGSNEELVSLVENAGHSTHHTGKLCGVSRAHLLGMSLALANEVDYWVYIEQDALIYGDEIIEKAIENMTKPYMFGAGWGTPQPMQQSFMIIKREAIPTFIKNFIAIKARDNQISPETKFAIAVSPFLKMLPESLFYDIHAKSFKNRVVWRLFKMFQGFDDLPFGYGRQRPLDFNDKYLYFQHGDKKELDNYIEKLEA